MTDRELLELAAKAAGHKVKWTTLDGGWADGYEALRFSDGTRFDPLKDDGDALRLAVKLRITPRVHLQGYSPAVTAQSIVDSYTEICGDDEMAAARRSIVRAAAEIGKRL